MHAGCGGTEGYAWLSPSLRIDGASCMLIIRLLVSGTLPDAIESECSKCTERQKDGAAKVTHYLIDNKPNEWDELAVKYDPSGEYKRKYLEEKEAEQTTEHEDSDEE